MAGPTLTLLFIEFLDELACGAREAAWPLIRILRAQLYLAMPGRSGTAMTVGNVFGLAGG